MPSSATPTPATYPLSLHDALPISGQAGSRGVSRSHRLLDHAERDGVGRFLTITGGKATTFRLMAEETVDAVCTALGRPVPCRTHLRSEEHTSELQSRGHLVCRLLLPRPPRPTPFPYTTLFRSPGRPGAGG